MKKIIGLFAAAALAFGVIGCTNDDLEKDEYLTRAAADEGTVGTYSLLQTAKKFTVTNSSGAVVTSVSVKRSLKENLTLSTENIVAEVDDEKVAKAVVNDKILTIEGVSEGTTEVILKMLTVSSELLAEMKKSAPSEIDSCYMEVGSVTVTVEPATVYQAAWFNSDAEVRATLSGADGYDKAIEASSIVPAPNSTFNAAAAEKGDLNGFSGYLVKQAGKDGAQANEEFINYTFSVKAKKDLTLDKLAFNATNNQSGNTAIKISYSTDGTDYNDFEPTNSDDKKFVVEQDLANIGKIEKDKTIYFKISHYATKATANKQFSVLLGQVRLTFLDTE